MKTQAEYAVLPLERVECWRTTMNDAHICICKLCKAGSFTYVYINADDAVSAIERTRAVFPDKFTSSQKLHAELVIPSQRFSTRMKL